MDVRGFARRNGITFYLGRLCTPYQRGLATWIRRQYSHQHRKGLLVLKPPLAYWVVLVRTLWIRLASGITITKILSIKNADREYGIWSGCKEGKEHQSLPKPF